VELSKDFPNEETIRKLYPGNLINIAIIIKDIIESQVRTGKRSQDDLNQIQELVKVLNEKYNMTNILKFEQGNYIQQYDERMEFRVAEQEAQLEQQSSELSHTKHELEISKKHGRETSEHLDEQTDEIRKLKEKIAKLESELGTEKSKNAVLNATIRTFITESEKRATGSVLNKGKDLAAQIAKLKASLEKQ
jgi:chromosome segregation ATPase